MVATGTGYESVAALNAAGDASVVGTVMFVMSICIMGGLIAILLFGKKIQMGLTKARNKHGELGGLICMVLTVLCAVVLYKAGIIKMIPKEKKKKA